jgi:hypothetical protein
MVDGVGNCGILAIGQWNRLAAFNHHTNQVTHHDQAQP